MKRFLEFPLIILITIILAAGCDKLPIEVGKPRPPICWFVALDVTRSISQNKFNTMRDEMITELVLSRIRNNDEIHLIQLDDYPEDDIEVFDVRGGKTGLKNEAISVWKEVKKINQSRSARYTNIGAVLRYISTIINDNIREHKRIGNARPEPINIAIIISDGKPTGRQIQVKDFPQKEVHLWFFGIDKPDQIPAIDAFCEKNGFKVQCVPYGYWKSRCLHFAEEFGRRQDLSIVRKICSPEEERHSTDGFVF